MARHNAPESCTEDDCTHSTHTRTFERSPDVRTRPHPDAPLLETVCPIHGIVYSR